MDNTTQFVRDLNVTRFVDKLRVEHDPSTRASIQRLLLKELKVLGFDREQLSNIQRHIIEGRRQIERQKAVLEILTTKGHDVRPAEHTLRNLVEIQRILEQHRQALLDSSDRNRS